MAAKYRLTNTDSIERTTDGASIPKDKANRDRKEYDDWVAAGNAPDPYVEPPEQVAARTRRAAFDADATRTDLLDKLRNSTPAQISTYVDTNVTNLADARALFKKILLVMSQ